jgi:hypothetical protein
VPATHVVASDALLPLEPQHTFPAGQSCDRKQVMLTPEHAPGSVHDVIAPPPGHRCAQHTCGATHAGHAADATQPGPPSVVTSALLASLLEAASPPPLLEPRASLVDCESDTDPESLLGVLLSEHPQPTAKRNATEERSGTPFMG